MHKTGKGVLTQTTDGHLMLKTVKGTVNKQMYTTGGYLMLKTVRGAV